MKRVLLACSIVVLSALAADGAPAEPGILAFARGEVAAACRQGRCSAPSLAFEHDAQMGAQGFQLVRGQGGGWIVRHSEPAGALYGALELAEALRLGTTGELAPGVKQPHVAQRGIKFNIPLDLRTPSYSDCSDAAQANIPEMWSREFWTAFLDEMARHRYNVLSLWSLHPFPSLVKVPEFPQVALDDVWRTRAKLDGSFSGIGVDMVRPAMLADVEVVRRMTIDEKIAFWRWVMQRAQDRGIEVYLFTWNVFTFGAEGRHGITRDMGNPVTKAYFRASVREMVKTYPLLAGFGVTAGEGMPHSMDARLKERWLFETYGEGVRDALREQPGRRVRMIHRLHWTAGNEVLEAWKAYPGYPETFSFSFKYSVAHMYSHPRPPFIQPLLERLDPSLRTWLTVRNDDIYSFRWGDPTYAREYVLGMPPASQLAGFYMGPDGYTWGRSFLERDATQPRPLVIEKQWYSFAIWGRLAFDPKLPDSRFEALLHQRFPDVSAADLFRATRAASGIVPQVTRFFWGDIDEKWYPEACLSKPVRHGFYTLRHFAANTSMPGAGTLDVRGWRRALRDGRAPVGITPPQVAGALEAMAAETEALLPDLRKRAGRNAELLAWLDDLACYAALGRYYAEKIRGAAEIALFDDSRDARHRQASVTHMEQALEHWKAYAALRNARYVPALYNRVGYVDLQALVEKVAADVAIAREWTPGSLDETRDATEKGFVP